MSIGELQRKIDSFNRVNKHRLQEKATFDYIQAELIAVGFSMCFNKQARFPPIEEVYPQIFGEEDEEEVKAKKEKEKIDISVLRFLQFKEKNNTKFNKQVVETVNE